MRRVLFGTVFVVLIVLGIYLVSTTVSKFDSVTAEEALMTSDKALVNSITEAEGQLTQDVQKLEATFKEETKTQNWLFLIIVLDVGIDLFLIGAIGLLWLLRRTIRGYDAYC